MTNSETRDRAATVAEQGAHVGPAKAPSKGGAGRKTAAPKAKKRAKAAKAAKAPRAKRAATDARRQQEGRGDRDDESRQGCDPRRDRDGHWLAEAHGARLRQHPWRQGR